MKRRLFLLVGCCSCSWLAAQEWNGYAGPAVTGDGFLRDREVTQAKPRLSIQPGAGIILGTDYHTESGFNLFAEGTFSWQNVQFPTPRGGGDDNSRFHSYFQTRLMVGSGPAIRSWNEAHIVTPFIQLGAGYMTDWNTPLRAAARQDHFMALCGAGINWYFTAIVPSSLNLNITYSPLNAFKEPVKYEELAPDGSVREMQLQGKLLQATLSCRVYLRFHKKDG